MNEMAEANSCFYLFIIINNCFCLIRIYVYNNNNNNNNIYKIAQ